MLVVSCGADTALIYFSAVLCVRIFYAGNKETDSAFGRFNFHKNYKIIFLPIYFDKQNLIVVLKYRQKENGIFRTFILKRVDNIIIKC